jgi:hypothetical protein
MHRIRRTVGMGLPGFFIMGRVDIAVIGDQPHPAAVQKANGISIFIGLALAELLHIGVGPDFARSVLDMSRQIRNRIIERFMASGLCRDSLASCIGRVSAPIKNPQN